MSEIGVYSIWTLKTLKRTIMKNFKRIDSGSMTGI